MKSIRELVRGIKSAAAVGNPYRIQRAERLTGKMCLVGCHDAKNRDGLQVRVPADIGWLWVAVNPSDLVAPDYPTSEKMRICAKCGKHAWQCDCKKLGK